MLRILNAWILLFLAATVSGQTYTEPSPGELDAQREVVGSALGRAESMARGQSFLDSLVNDRERIERIRTQAGVGSGVNLDAVIQELRGDGFLSQALAAGQQVFDNMGSPRYDEATAPLVLVSFSMPRSQIQALIHEAHGIGASVVLRGLVDNDLPTTIKAMQTLADGSSGGGLAIDPTIFSRFEIDAVPAFVLPIDELSPCDNTGCVAGDAVIAKGSTTLRYFLELVQRTGSGKISEIASSWLEKYKGD